MHSLKRRAWIIGGLCLFALACALGSLWLAQRGSFDHLRLLIFTQIATLAVAFLQFVKELPPIIKSPGELELQALQIEKTKLEIAALKAQQEQQLNAKRIVTFSAVMLFIGVSLVSAQIGAVPVLRKLAASTAENKELKRKLEVAATEGNQPPAAPITSPVPPPQFSIALPDAYSGRSYVHRIVGAFGLAHGGLACSAPIPSLPSGLTFDCDQLTLSGTATTVTTVAVKSYVIVRDMRGESVELDLSFTLRPATTHVRSNIEPLPDSIIVTTAIAEGTWRIAGYVAPTFDYTATKLSIRVWIQPENGPPYLAPLKAPATSPGTGQVYQVVLPSDSSFSINLVNPLPAGSSVHLELVDSTGYVFTKGAPIAIP